MRPLTGRHGVTLLELLLAITLLALVGAVVTTVIVAASRVAGRATNQLALERTVHTAQALLGQELRDADWGDVSVGADAIRLPRTIGAGTPCASAAGSVVVAREAWEGERAPEAGRDFLRVLDAETAAWQEGAVTDVLDATCPSGAPAWRLVSSAASVAVAAVRVVERVVLRRYVAGSAEWLGLAPADGSSPVQPFAGPLLPGFSRFARVGEVLQLELVAVAGARTLALPLGAAP
jgi:prepilin-type N-terminal cleavage/methylation domain-containing protein